jgi:hypothetical protein
MMLMRNVFTISAIGLALLLSSCASKDTAGQPHATVLMRDGTEATGTITASSPSEITLAVDGGATRTIPMLQVRSIEYSDPPQTAAASSSGQTSATPTPAASYSPTQSDTVHERHFHPSQSAIRTKTNHLAVGTQIAVRTEETIDSARAAEGQTYAAEVSRDVVDEAGDLVIPGGSNAQIIIKSATKGGRFHGKSDLVLDLQSVSVEGQKYQLSTADLEARGKDGVGGNRRTAEYTGGGAAVGAIIGAIAGGGRGAAIGAGSGAGAGALTQIITKGSIRVPAETVLTFKLDRPLRVEAAR